MRRATLSLVSTMGAVVLAAMLIAPGAIAQDEMSVADHPVVGTWATADGGFATYHPDGTFIGVDPDGAVSLGVWEPTGDRSADLTFRTRVPGEDGGTIGFATVRAVVEVAEDGMTGSFDATVEMPMPDGGTTGQLGPIPLAAERILVEAMGEPVAPFPEEMAE